MSKALETLKGHMGKSIRALACHEGLIATGGDDGAIKVWNAVDILKKKAVKEEEEEEKKEGRVVKVRVPMPDGSMPASEKDVNQIRCVEIMTLNSELD